MKKVSIFITAFLFNILAAFGSENAPTPAQAWNELYPATEAQIKAPTFRDKDYNILDYGKRSDTKGYLYTELINNVIKKCSEEGGGRVIVPGLRMADGTDNVAERRKPASRRGRHTTFHR